MEDNKKNHEPIVGDYFDELNGNVKASDYYGRNYEVEVGNTEHSKFDEEKLVETNVKNSEEPEEKVNYSKGKHEARKSNAKKVVAIATAVLVAMAMFHAIRKSSKNVSINEYIRETYGTILSDNTYRTEDNQGFWYDTAAIAKEVENSDNKDEILFALSKLMVNPQQNMDSLAAELGSENFEKYIEKNGYKDIDEFNNVNSDSIQTSVLESKKSK